MTLIDSITDGIIRIMSEYQGSSAGFKTLQNDYYAYSQEVLLNRALPDVRDGLKPVHRRIIQGFLDRRITNFTKSVTVVGAAIEYHPHGDASIYDAMVLMTDSNGSWNVPLLSGQGSWGAVYSSIIKAAAARYTECKLSPWANDLLQDYAYTPQVARESGEGLEPEVLPSRYPFLLVTGSKGMGVAISTMIPSFNFWEVLDLTRTYLSTGDFQGKTIFPDFPTGGSLVADPNVATALAYTGRTSFSTRCAASVEGNLIVISEVAYGQTSDGLANSINQLAATSTLNYSASVADDLIHGCRVTVLCGKGVDPEEVLVELLRNKVLQSNGSSYMVWVTEDGEIREAGVYEIIKEWVKFRRKILTKRFTSELESAHQEMERLGYFVTLVNDTSARDAFLDKLVNESRSAARVFLGEYFESIPSEVADWILERRAASFNRSNAYQERYARLEETCQDLQHKLDNIDQTIIEDLDQVALEHQGFHERRTELSLVDFQPERTSSRSKPTASYQAVFTWVPDTGVITKDVTASSGANRIEFSGDSQDTLLLGLTINGNVAKIWASDLVDGDPVSIAALCGLDPDDTVVYMVSSGSPEQLLVFLDGGLSWWNPSSERTKRRTKLHKNALPSLVGIGRIVDSVGVESVSWAYDTPEGSVSATSVLSGLSKPKQSSTKIMGQRLDSLATHLAFNTGDHDHRPMIVDQDWSQFEEVS